LRKTVPEVWQETVNYLSQPNPEKLTKAASNPKQKMALVFRWYLG
jgi:hypothetical protein